MSGPTGLDYQGVRALLSEMGLQGQERQDIFNTLRACEHTQLECWEQRRRQEQTQG